MFKHNRSGGNRGFRRASPSKGSFSPKRGRFQPKNLDPRLFIKPATPTEAAEINIKNTFQDLGLHSQLLENLVTKGFTTPTPIQDQALTPALNGSDVLGLADTGTGKTAAFVLPILQKMIANANQTALIVAPTRELAVQIRDEIRSLSTGLPIYTCVLIGGSDIRRQLDDLRRRPHIYIGTPGRLKDLYNRRALHLTNTATVVLDEVDRMLDMGFINDITTLLSFVPKERQTLLFSATIDKRGEGIAVNFMKNPVKISVKTGPTAHNVEQNIVRVQGKSQKLDVLSDLLVQDQFKKVLVFGRTKYGVEEISLSLQKRGFSADAIHGNKRQNQRENVLRKFKNNQLKVLVATDVAARGIDVKDITHVINFDQPGSYDDYVHRIGRTGRAGQKGFALTFVD